MKSLPALPLNSWLPTYQTLHMWTQIIGKIKLMQTPLINHWWNVTFHVIPEGFTTLKIPHGDRDFEIRFNFLEEFLSIETSDGDFRVIRLEPKAVAEFYQEVMLTLDELGLPVQIRTMPCEVPNPIACDLDDVHASYDPESARKLHEVLLAADDFFQEFRSEFIGKCSPVHFFWGSFDLAVTRFSGRAAPERPGADSITREAYSHEVISAGFWPGSGNIQEAAFYAYAAPEPVGFSESNVRPSSAFYNEPTRGFILRYEDVRNSKDPRQTLLDFLESTYEAAANLGNWDRMSLERNVVSIRKKAA